MLLWSSRGTGTPTSTRCLTKRRRRAPPAFRRATPPPRGRPCPPGRSPRAPWPCRRCRGSSSQRRATSGAHRAASATRSPRCRRRRPYPVSPWPSQQGACHKPRRRRWPPAQHHPSGSGCRWSCPTGKRRPGRRRDPRNRPLQDRSSPGSSIATRHSTRCRAPRSQARTPRPGPRCAPTGTRCTAPPPSATPSPKRASALHLPASRSRCPGLRSRPCL
mmetsp:Transcript_105322/g.293205  ORF Transcript_105322/g.293205 Transcript_105322/m.293205 type:complete len:218 (-) Transcript_105322:1074-1727(-)